MAAENETKGFFTKIAEAVTAFIGKFTGGAKQTSPDGSSKIGAAGEKLADAGEKIAEKAGQLKDRIPVPESVEKTFNSVKDKAGEVVGKITKDMDPEKVAKLKQGGLAAGGAVATLDGVRRIAKKDENGKRHIVKGTLEAGAGIGMFTAAVIARRNGASNDGPQR